MEKTLSVILKFCTILNSYTVGYSWSAKVHEILADLGTDFYFADPLRSNLTTLRDLASHSNGIYRNAIILFQNMTRAEQASRLR